MFRKSIIALVLITSSLPAISGTISQADFIAVGSQNAAITELQAISPGMSVPEVQEKITRFLERMNIADLSVDIQKAYQQAAYVYIGDHGWKNPAGVVVDTPNTTQPTDPAITDAIKQNTRQIDTNNILIAIAQTVTASQSQAIQTNTKTNKAQDSQIQTNAKGIATNQAGLVDARKAITSNSNAIATNSTAIARNTGAIATNSKAIATNATGIASNRASIDANRGAILSHSKAIADTNKRLTGLESANNSRFANMDKRINENRKQASAGTSAAMAQANIPQVMNDQHFALGVGIGGYDNQNAVAVGVSFRAGSHTVIKATVSEDTADNVGYGAGVSVGW